MIPFTKTTFLVLCCALSSALLWGQPARLQLAPISARPVEAPGPARAKQAVVLNLPFFDDFSGDSHQANPALWQNSRVWVNQTWARGSVTLGVATFEGLDADGFPYNLQGKDSLADVLESQTIDLSAATGSVYLSFFWQETGFGEAPSLNDSLSLQVWGAINDSTQGWQSIWRQRGSGLEDSLFHYEAVRIDSTFHTSDFKFRFASYGSMKGAFDFWHLDRVYLDQNRSAQDSLDFNDIGFTRPAPSILGPFQALPWFHYDDITAQAINARRVSLQYRQHLALNNVKTVNLAEYTIRSGGQLLDQGPARFTISNGHLRNEETRFAVPDIQQAGKELSFTPPNLPADTAFDITIMHTWDGSEQNARTSNDTLRRVHSFRNYYAYDDGSAERALEVTKNENGVLLSRYDIQPGQGSGANRLRGVYLYFLPSLYDITQNQFSLVIAADEQGIPGSIIYESDSLYTPRYTAGNYYWPYVLDTSGIDITGPVFIGFRQKKATPLPIGFDRNSTGFTTTFFGSLANIFQSFIPGTVMMRPFFKHLPENISLPENELTQVDWQVFPNPVTVYLHVKYPERKQMKLRYTLVNSIGQLQKTGMVNGPIDLQHMQPGLYILTLQNEQYTRSFKISKH